MNPLFIIPARGGSKGLPGKNIKPLGGKPLINYSIDMARAFVEDTDICVSTDDREIAAVAEKHGLQVPFMRPAELATDGASSQDVLVHAVKFYQDKGINYDRMVLLQPTSPFRKAGDVKACMNLYSGDIDMVVSVKESHANPYISLFEETSEGFLVQSKKGNFVRRQDCPNVYLLNGSVYVINIQSLLKEKMADFKRVKKYVMDDVYSVDIDTQNDWDYAEYLLEKRKVQRTVT